MTCRQSWKLSVLYKTQTARSVWLNHAVWRYKRVIKALTAHRADSAGSAHP
jgi:hypothetical protein